jgi:hypothetical protein
MTPLAHKSVISHRLFVYSDAGINILKFSSLNQQQFTKAAEFFLMFGNLERIKLQFAVVV